MLDVVFAALRSRRAATIALWVLTCLVVTGVTAAPCVLATTIDRITVADATEAPVDERTVVVTADVTLQTLGIGGTVTNTSGVATTTSELEHALTIPGAGGVTTLEVDGAAGAPLRGTVAYAYRPGVCAYTALAGACPSGPGEAMVSQDYATALGLHLGDTVTWTGPSQNNPPTLRVVGVYRPLAPRDPYWGGDLLAADQPLGGDRADAIFVSEAAIEADTPSLRCVRTLIVTPAAIGTYGADRIDRDITAAVDLATSRDYTVTADFAPLAARVLADRSYTTTTIGALAAELVALGWFALYLVLRAVAGARRADVGIHLLHGLPRRRIAALAGLQDALPVVAGVPVGVIAGVAGARLLAGPLPAGRIPEATASASGAVAAVLIGAMLAAALAERRASRGSIPDLLRNTPPTRRGWRSAVIDLIVLAVAITAVVQVRVGSAITGLSAIAASLVALAIAVLAARLLAPACRWAIAGGLRRGRATGVLTATHLARRRGLDRMLILLVIAVAALTSAVVSVRVGAAARSTRAVQTLGADRVVELRNVSVARVLADTHAADPGGRYLMAASAYASGGVLAVDTSRLGRVLASSGTWPGGAAIARTLSAPTPAPTAFRDGMVTLSADVTSLPPAPVVIAADLTDASGTPSALTFGPITSGRHDYTAALTGCPSGCDLVDLRIAPATAAVAGQPLRDVTVVVSALAPAGDPGGGVPAFADRTRWRTSGQNDVVGPTLASADGGLRIDIGHDNLSGEVRFDARVYPIDAPLPLPAIAAGPSAPDGSGAATVTPYADLAVPVRVAARTPVLPQLGTAGMLVDLTAALRLDGGLGDGGTPQIWMRADTPAAIAHRVLAGRDVESDRTLGSVRAGLDRAAPGITARFTLVAGLIAMLVAVTAMALTDSFERGADLIALRRQGLRTTTVRRTATARHAAVTVTALLAGVVAVAVSRLLLRVPDTVFSDGWRTPPAPGASYGSWWPAIAAAAIPMAIAAGMSARRLAARVIGATR
jgi:hypothetical protein